MEIIHRDNTKRNKLLEIKKQAVERSDYYLSFLIN